MEKKNAIVSKTPLAGNYGPEFLEIKSGNGSWLEDITGKRYLDFTAGIAVNALGYGREDLARAAYEQMRRVIHTSNLYTTEPVLKLAERMVASGDFAAVHFSNSGSEANETALKYARLYSLRKKGPGHHRILTFTNAFHGRSLGALSCTPNEKYQKPFEPLIPGVEVAPYNDVVALKEKLDESFAAVIVEVIQGEGGLEIMEASFAGELQDAARKNDVILIVDEVQTGLSRTGRFYASQWVGLKPDILTLAKPLAAGLPLSATLIPEKVNSLIHVGEHGSTFGGGPVTTAVALKVWEILSNEHFISETAQKGDYFKTLLEELSTRYDFLGKVKGKGLLRGLEYRGEEKGDELADRIKGLIGDAREKGLLILRSGKNILRFAPPLTITKEELEKGIDILNEVFKEMKEI